MDGHPAPGSSAKFNPARAPHPAAHGPRNGQGSLAGNDNVRAAQAHALHAMQLQMDPGIQYAAAQLFPPDTPPGPPHSYPLQQHGQPPHQQVQGLMTAYESLRHRELQLQHQLDHLHRAQGYGPPGPVGQHQNAFHQPFHGAPNAPQAFPPDATPRAGLHPDTLHQSQALDSFTTLNDTTSSAQPQGSWRSPDSLDSPTPEPSKSVITLEDRLRGLILQNAELQAGARAGRDPATVGGHVTADSADPQALPPHMRTASEDDQKTFPIEKGEPDSRDSSSATAPKHVKTTSTPRRKKPNQHQRKQMRATLNADMDATPPIPDARSARGPAQSSRGGGQPRVAPADQPGTAAPEPPKWQTATNPAATTSYHVRAPRQQQQHQQQQRSGPNSTPSRGQQPQPRAQPQYNIQQRHGYQQNQQQYLSQQRQQQDMYRQHQQQARHLFECQARYLQSVAAVEVPRAAIEPDELKQTEAFRRTLEEVCRRAITAHEAARGGQGFDGSSIELKCFGSLSSGFATKSSDMDLALVSPNSDPSPESTSSPIPRILEKAFLEMGHGARLLTRTRVPIIKLCEKPTSSLMAGLLKERKKWEDAPEPAALGQVEAPHDDNHLRPRSESKGTADTDRESVPTSVEADLARPKQLLFETPEVIQSGDESIWSYYRRAKGQLEKLGLEDITPKGGAEGGRLLNLFCEAYVDGLHDDDLKQRLKGFRSMDFEANVRSLVGVWYQAEGERIARSWETRPLIEATPDKERQGETVVREWRQLQDKVTPDVVNYNRSLHRYWDRLKLLHSAQLGLLMERPEDTPDTYYVRCATLLRELGGRDGTPSLAPPLTDDEHRLLRYVLRAFLDGIRDAGIRNRLKDLDESIRNQGKPPMILADLYAQHDAEHQLAVYWAAHESKGQPEQERRVVEEYTRQMRLKGTRGVDANVAKDFRSTMQANKQKQHRTRERFADHLEFPKVGVGIQCDVNFSNHLALYNTLMLRCYAHCDARVRDVVVFVKAWAKRRRINSPYHGTLSSYGYVLMVLHYLVNIAQPPVVPNLQLSRGPSSAAQPDQADRTATVDGYKVSFWRDEAEIRRLAAEGSLTRNRQTVGSLLVGFIEYYAAQGPHVVGRGFSWQTDVLSLRTAGGLLTKREKGWTGARTTVTEATQPGQHKKEVRHRYLFAVEDPFETDHNIARTVTHNGIVAIRDELRRALRIINRKARDDTRDLRVPGEGELFEAAEDPEELAQRTLSEAKAARDVTTEDTGVSSGSAVDAASTGERGH